MPRIKPVRENDPQAKHDFCEKLIDWLAERELWCETSVYVNGERWSSEVYGRDVDVAITKETPKSNKYYVTPQPDPKAIVEYANPDLITMTFEGPLYMVLNENPKIENEFFKLFAKHGMYAEYGYTWSLSAYEDR